MRWLSGIHPDYADKVAVYLVSYDTFQDVVKEEEHIRQQGWTWPVAHPVGTMLRDYWIVIASTKVAFDSRGVVTYRAGFGEGTKEDLRRVVQELAASR
jgi:hypothetical protein